MNKKINKYIYYAIVILMLLFAEKIVVMFKNKDDAKVINYTLAEENKSLKAEIKELSNLEFHNYDYILGKITIKKLYQSNTYFIETPTKVANNLPVINNWGLIGLYNNSYLVPTNALNLSIKVDDINGTLKNGLIKISAGDYNIGDKIYTTGLTNIPGDLLIGYIKSIDKSNNNLEDTIEVNFIENNTTYVAILTNYA
jgi:cell shape-determining protein MreC